MTTQRSFAVLTTRLMIIVLVLLVQLLGLLLANHGVNGFFVTTPTTTTRTRRSHLLLLLGSVKSSSSTHSSADAVTSASVSVSSIAKITLEGRIDQAISNFLKSSGNDKKQEKQNHLIALIEEMEAMNECDAPNRSPLFFGEWHTWWTNCPPPSDGQLGPFRGTSQQVIATPTSSSDSSDSADASSALPLYQNLLKVAPNDWLMAILDGVYQDWNGIPLKEKNNNDKNRSSQSASTTSTSTSNTNTTMDWGANHWKVTFIKLTIYLLGIPLFSKNFDANTSRVWRTTYMDNGDTNNIRIVRASQTGLAQDEVIFYTKRRPSPFV